MLTKKLMTRNKALLILSATLVTGPLLMGPLIAGQAMANEEDESVKTASGLLSAQLGDDTEITLVSHAQVTWPNGALGCPKPGMNYTQATVKGYRIVLSANDRQYFYHGRDGGQPLRCANPEPSHRWIMDR